MTHIMSSSSSARATKKSAFSCEPCRRRKVKCGGEQPKCKRCEARSDECIYKLNPTLSYTQRLEQRIKDLEEQLATVRKSPPSQAGSSSHSSPPQFTAFDPQSEPGLTRNFRGLKIDDKGGITYHGATSFFHLPGCAQQTKNDLQSTADMERRREKLVTNAWQARAMENMSAVPEPFQYLLNIHWCWIQPLFNFIYRPAFTRDMQSLGQYYSHTLLNAILSHSIRWATSDPNTKRLLDESYESGAMFGKHARSMVFDELNRGICTIPTIQTLLLLSAQECGYGNSTQAWTYSGLAFRLVDHLGICLDGQRLSSSVPLSDEDVEIRRRLFWSCYFWDKMISLYLGRSPSLQQSTVSPPQVIFDDSSETEPWSPFGLSEGERSWNYTPQAAHSTSAFMSMCRLSMIFNEILIHMYDPLRQNTEDEVAECLQTQEPALQQWWDHLPDYLKINTDVAPETAPPSHVVTMNALFHTFKILLHRPMLTRRGKPEDDAQQQHMQNHLVECVNSATSTIAIFDLFCRTFGVNYCVLSLAYSVYIAATIFLLQVQASPEDQQAMKRLQFCIQCLTQAKLISPIIANAVNLIAKQLESLGISIESLLHDLPPEYHMPTSYQSPTQAYQPPPDISGQPGVVPQEQLFQPQWPNQPDPNTLTMDPGIFEAMSSFEPLTVRVGALQGGVPRYEGTTR